MKAPDRVCKRAPIHRRALRLASVLLPAMLAATGNLCGQSSAAGSLTLEEANRRWAGAACTLQTPITISGKNRTGWVASRWIPVPGFYTVHPITGTVGCASCTKEELPFSYSMMVSDRSALSGLMRGKEIPAGTELVARGWQATSADRGFILAMRFRDAPVEAQFHFGMTPKDIKKGMSWDRLAQIEQFMRVEMFQLTAADEQLAPMDEVLEIAEAVEADPPRPLTALQPAESATFRPQVRVDAVSVSPPRFQAGMEIELIVTFTLAGLPSGAPFEVSVEHQIWQGDSLIAALPETVSYPAGTHTNSRTVRSDPAQAPGLYTLRTTVSLAGMAATGSALFAVE